MSFRKKTLTRPNVGALRKKPAVESNLAQGQSLEPNKDLPEVTKIDIDGEETPQTPATTASTAPTGTKLAKRIKPKVNIRSSISRNPSKDNVGKNDTQNSSTIVESIDTGQTLSNAVEPVKVPVSEEKQPVEPTLEKPNEMQSKEIDIKNSGNEKPDSKRLAKRLKVNPKLGNPRSVKTISVENDKKTDDVVGTKCPDPQNNDVVDDVKIFKEEEVGNQKGGETDLNESKQTVSKLQKRKKIMPNLRIPSKVKSNESVSTAVSTGQVSKTVEETTAKQTDDSSVDTPDVNKKSRHVRFKPSTDGQQQNESGVNKGLPTINENNSENVDSPLTPKNNLLPKQSILKKDTYDYSSQSEGELSSHSTSLHKGKKVFKPNLGARRRKRLSSFSAYSSCDDDEDDNEVDRKKSHKTHSDNDETTETLHSPKKKTEDVTEAELSSKKRKNHKTKRDKENEELLDSDDEDDEGVENKPTKKKAVRRNRKICTEEKDISMLTMQELIFYRPKSLQKVELRVNKSLNDLEETSTILPDPVQQEDVKGKKEENGDDDDCVIAPQIMLNENGEVVINDDSLTIKKKIDDSQLKRTDILYENSLSNSNHRRKVSRVKRWKMHETLRFYKALSQIGTDFTLMSQAFGRFTRNELKKKFKQEEKINCDLVDMALANRLPLNMDMFLRGKEELQEFLEEEAKLLSSTKQNNKTGKKSSDKESFISDKDDSTSITELPECVVEIERAKIDVEALTGPKDKNSTTAEDEQADQHDNFTDFQRTDGDINSDGSSTDVTTLTTKTTTTTEKKRVKKRRLQIIDDDSDE